MDQPVYAQDIDKLGKSREAKTGLAVVPTSINSLQTIDNVLYRKRHVRRLINEAHS